MELNLIDVRAWIRAATRRLDAAKLLCDNQKYTGASYLAGYVTECALKGVLLAHVPLHFRKKYIGERFKGEKAHNFEHLCFLIRKEKGRLPTHLIDRVQGMSWSTDLRYEAALGEFTEAADLIESGEAILKWAQENLRGLPHGGK